MNIENVFTPYGGVVTREQAHALAVLFNYYETSDQCAKGEEMLFYYNKVSNEYYICFNSNNLSIVLTPKDEVFWTLVDYRTGEETYFDTEEEALESNGYCYQNEKRD